MGGGRDRGCDHDLGFPGSADAPLAPRMVRRERPTFAHRRHDIVRSCPQNLKVCLPVRFWGISPPRGRRDDAKLKHGLQHHLAVKRPRVDDVAASSASPVPGRSPTFDPR